MSKWEITAGREDLVWYDRESRPDHKNHWWVMTWIKNGPKSQDAWGALPVWCSEDGKTLMMYMAVPDRPNVEMFFYTTPFTNDE